MKRISLLTLLAILFLFSCKKDDGAAATTTSAFVGNWKITKYDGQTLNAPIGGTYNTVSSAATTGTAAFDITFDGTTHQTENDSYILSSSNTKVDFTKTSGNFTVLSGGGTWTINTLDEHNLKMTSAYGLILEMNR